MQRAYHSNLKVISYEIFTVNSSDIELSIESQRENVGAKSTEIWWSKGDDSVRCTTEFYIS